MRWMKSVVVLVGFAIAGCASTSVPVAPPEPDAPLAPDCRVARATGDVAALLRATGELVIVGGGVELLRSDDLGQSWRREALPLSCRWPDLTEVAGRLLVSCSESSSPGRLLVLAEKPGGGWSEPVVADITSELVIDTNLQPIEGGTVLLFATHIDRPDDLDDSVYTVRSYRSEDAGASWSMVEDVVVGRRGDHLEDPRSVRLADGTVLLAYELEPVEAGASSLLQLRSTTGGRSWTGPSLVWRGGDVEPGGYLSFTDGELWLVASSDEAAGEGSYDRAVIQTRRSWDDGRSWTAPEVLVNRENQISFGGVVLPGDRVLLPSLRFYNQRKRRQLSLYVVDRDAETAARCAAGPLSAESFEGDPQLKIR